MIETFVPHPLGEGTSVGGKACNADSDVVVDFEEFFLVGREFGDGPFEGSEDRVGGGSEADACGSLFDGFHCVFYLEESAFG